MTTENLAGINHSNLQLQRNPIAIIGMASIFPEAKNLHEYWENIIGKVDCITDVPSSHWNVADYYDPDPRAQDKTYCKRGGFIPKIDFNPMEFGLPPNILEVTDVSQLLSLVIAKQAMEDAGYGGQSRNFNRERTGIILGAVGRQLSVPLSARLQSPIWEKAIKSSGLSDQDTQKIVEKIKSAYVEWDENAFPGMLSNVIAGRIANRLDLGGINCTIDAACASSLAALNMAISELVEHRCDMMLAGGIDPDNSIFTYVCFSKTPALSLKQQSRPFDADADGMMLGEGLGMLVLKRLEDAERDHDRIYAVIKGIGSSSDGKYKSIYAPRPEGQVKALQRAYQGTDISPDSVSLIEAHGTGTMAGDPAEFAALNQFFRENNPRKQHIALGSVKSQIGHSKTAAGVASLIKTALALHHKILPPTINISKPNPKLKIDSSPFYLNTETRPWIRSEEEAARRAGVSSFGFGGTNFHVVLEEYKSEQNRAYRLHKTPQPVLVFAETPVQLLARCEDVLRQLQSDAGEQHYAELIDSCKSLEISVTSARVGFVADSLTEACHKLQTTIDLLKTQPESWEHPQGIYYRQSGMDLEGKVVALFSGQGSQYLEMGRELALNFPCVRQAYGQMDGLLTKDDLQLLSDVVFPPPVFEPAQKDAQVKRLQQTEYAQPAIGVFSVGLYKILQQAGFKPDFVAGHSFGELTALWAAEVLSDEDYFFLVKARGQAMAAPDEPNVETGTMMAVKGDISQVEAVVKQFPHVTIANFNSPRQVVLAGAKSEIATVQQTLTEQGYSAVLLPVSAAFHTPLVGHAQKPFAQAVKSLTFRSPKIPVYTNVTGKCYPSEPQTIQKILKEHLLNQVLFKQEIENIYAEGGYCFIEFGPRRILANLVTDILGDRPHLSIALNGSRQKDSDRQLREAVVQLRVAGLPLQNLDPYQQEQKRPETPTKKVLNVRIDGVNYLSEKSKMAFEKALQNGHSIKSIQAQSTPVRQPTPEVKTSPRQNGHQMNGHQMKSISNPGKVMPPAPSVVSASKGKILETTQVQSAPVMTQATPESKMKPSSEIPLNYQRVLESLEYSLEQFNQHQGATLEVHGQYLNHQMEYVRTSFQLMQQQHSLLFKGAVPSEDTRRVVLESSERSMLKFHEHQGATLGVHEQYLNHQMEYAKNFFQWTQQGYSLLLRGDSTQMASPTQPEATAAVAPPPSVAIDVADPSQTLVTAVSEKTGYPANMLERDMKADLGGVSPSIESQAAAFTSPEPATWQVIEPVPKLLSLDTESESKAKVASPSVAIDVADLSQTLLTVVSEKTGYPTDMLELDMDMEADLGIDSIKRVEILGALQEQFPDLPQPNLEELAEIELRTLSQVVDYMGTLVSENQQVQPVPTRVSPSIENQEAAFTNPEPATSLVVEPVPELLSPDTESESTAKVASPSVAIDVADLSQTLLTVVSEKTGYPTEMLELDMDMEADLGIDSIKRVEILGALQEQFPDLPQPNLEELAEIELRTLGHVVDYMGTLGSENQQVQPVPTRVSPSIENQEAAFTNPEPATSLVVEPVPELLSPDTKSESTAKVASPSVAIDVADLSQVLLTVVSEKTGYPTEMLELDMDMEADLGIDSIKRVEILGALQEQFPDLPQPNLEELAEIELRSLSQVVDYMGTLLSTAEKKNSSSQLDSREQLDVTSNILRSTVRLKFLPDPDRLDFTLPKQHICLLTDDGSLTTSKLAQSLTELGWKVVVLSFPPTANAKSSPLLEGIDRVVLKDWSEEHLKQQLAAISAKYGSIAAFIHLNPSYQGNQKDGILFPEEEAAIVKHVFFIAKHLKNSLNEAARQGRSCFLTVARLDGEFGLGRKVNFSPMGAGLFGLTKTLNYEWKPVFCRTIDLSPDINAEQSTQYIIDELHDSNRCLVEVGYGSQGRTTLISELAT